MAAEQRIACAPLVNFVGTPGLDFEILPGVRLHQASPELDAEVARWLNLARTRLPPFATNVRPTWVLEMVGPESTADVPREPLGYGEFSRALSALRVFKDGLVSWPFVAEGSLGPSQLRFGSSQGSIFFPPDHVWGYAIGKPYGLAAPDLDSLLGLAAEVDRRLKNEPESGVAIAITRLDFIQQRWLESDRIIDGEIAIEAILGEGLQGEITFRHAVRGAWLLGTTPAERERLFGELKGAYNRRSRLAHGDIEEERSPSADRIVSLARAVVRAFVELPRGLSHREIVGKLDVAAVTGHFEL